MKQLLFIFLLMHTMLPAQELALVKATMQTINYGASPGSVTNYVIQLCKTKKFAWGIDSVCGILSGKPVKYNFLKIDDPDVLSPQYKPVKLFSKKDKGQYLIKFGIGKRRAGGRPGAPQNMMADTENVDGGVIIYYRAGKKHKQLKVEVFEQLETVNAP
jgi:hypothetical protein